jgi:hypothetical protein
MKKFNLNKNWYHIIYTDTGVGGVKVCKHMAHRASWRFAKVNDAINFLKKKIKNKDYEIVVHNKDGSVRRMLKISKPISEEVQLKKMSPEQEQHLKLIIGTFSKSMDAKYRKGQQEHGGDLWRKKGLIDMAIEEALDQVCYLVTLKRQLEEAGIQLGDKEDKDVIQRRGN